MSQDENTNNISGDKALKRVKDRVKILERSIADQQKELERLRKVNERQKDKIEKLEDEIRSLRGVPDWIKPETKDPVSKTPAKRGPKKGHKPSVRKKPEHIDYDVHILPKSCSECDNHLPTAHKFHSHVQIDIPETTRPVVTEFHVGWSWCGCCKAERSCNFKLSSSLYGPRLHAFVSFLKFDQGLSLGKISTLLFQMYNLQISTGVLSEMLMRTGESFSAVSDALKDELSVGKIVHADETGWRVNGKNLWMWSFSSETTSYYTIVSSRGQKVVEETLGKSFDGVLVSDFYGGYNRIKSNKQRCWAHLLRDVKKLCEEFPNDRELCTFDRRLKSIFRRGQRLRLDKRQGQAIGKPVSRLKSDLLNLGMADYKKYYLKTLAKRLIKFRSELLTFVDHDCEPTNNNAEREIRPAVLMRKISYQNTSAEGASTQSTMMSIIRTAKKRNVNFLRMATHFLAQEHHYQ